MSGDEDSLRMSPEGPGVDCDQGREEVRLWVEAISSGGDIATLITQEQAQQSEGKETQYKDCQTSLLTILVAASKHVNCLTILVIDFLSLFTKMTTTH